MSIGKSIRYYREQKDVSQQWLADAIGVSKMTVSNFESDFLAAKRRHYPGAGAETQESVCQGNPDNCREIRGIRAVCSLPCKGRRHHQPQVAEQYPEHYS